jgi:hypothetical protein
VAEDEVASRGYTPMSNASAAAAGNRNPYVYVLFIQDDFQLTPFLQGFVVSSLLVGAMA